MSPIPSLYFSILKGNRSFVLVEWKEYLYRQSQKNNIGILFANSSSLVFGKQYLNGISSHFLTGHIHQFK
jgi:hypothetical protein